MKRLVVVAALLLSGCALPLGAGVTTIRSVGPQDAQPEQDLRNIPPGPATGATPEALVTAFVKAQTDPDVALEFLTAPDAWVDDTTTTTTVFDNAAPPVVTLTSGGDTVAPTPTDGTGDPGSASDPSRTATVQLVVNRTAIVPPDAAVRPDAGAVTQQFTLRRVSGEWRIDAAPAGRLISDSDLPRSTRPAEVFFTTVDASGLVGEPVVLPGPTASLATQTVQALLDGVPARLTGVVATAVPAGTALVGLVSVTEGIAQVNLSGRSVPGGQNAIVLRDQLVASLLSVNGVTGVRLVFDGNAFPSSGPPFSASVLSVVDPDVGTPDVDWLEHGGRVEPLSTVSASPPVTPAPDGTPTSVSVRGSDAAVVRRAATGATTVRIEQADGESTPLPQLAGARSVQWADDGSLLSIGADGVLTVAITTSTAAPVAVPLTAGPGQAPPDGVVWQQVTLAPDGVHVALSTPDGHVYVGSLAPTAAPAVVDLHLFTVTGGPATSWATSHTLAVVGPAPHARLLLVDLGSTDTVEQPAVCGDAGPSTVAASPGRPLLVGCPAGPTAATPAAVWQLDSDWTQVATGSNPAWAR